MQIAFLPLIVAGLYPLYRAWQANRRTSLVYAVSWAGLAWLVWGAALVLGNPHKVGFDPWRYCALCLTGAAGVAVLGARRPQAGAWNLVILGLLAVLLLPLGESLFVGTPPTDGLRIVFLAATLAVGILNYVPTAVAVPALFLAGICAIECLVLFSASLNVGPRTLDLLHLSVMSVPWLALAFWQRPRRDSLELNRLWRDFRDRYGVFWAQRVREQYNRSAAHAGLPGLLYWHGWENDTSDPPPTEEQASAMQALLKTLLNRFDDE